MPKISWSHEELKDRNRSTAGANVGVDSGNSISQGYHHGSLTKGLVAYYPMEKGRGQVLHDGALNHLAQINGASWSSGKVGSNAISFDGSDDYVQSKAKSELDFKSSITISLWAKISSKDRVNSLIAKAPSSGSRNYQLHITKSNNEFAWFDSNNTTIASSYVPSLDSWVHYTAVFKKGSLKLYANGNKVHESTGLSNLPTNNGPLWIGEDAYDNTLDGATEDVRIYDRVLSKPEIKALYNGGNGTQSGTQITENDIPSQNQGGASRYKFNGNVDDSWNSNHATDNTSTGYKTGVYGKAKKFDGTDDYVSLPNFSQFSSYTVSFWSKHNSVSDGKQDAVVCLRGNNAILTKDDGSGKFKFNHQDSSGTWHPIKAPISNYQWNHWTISWNGNKTRLYKNGTLKGETSIGSINSLGHSDTVGVEDASSLTHYLDGSVDDVRIYNTSLTPVQIEKIYKKGAHRINRSDTLT